MFNLYHFIFQRLIWKKIPTPIPRIPTLIHYIPIISTLISRILIIPRIVDLKFNLNSLDCFCFNDSALYSAYSFLLWYFVFRDFFVSLLQFKDSNGPIIHFSILLWIFSTNIFRRNFLSLSLLAVLSLPFEIYYQRVTLTHNGIDYRSLQ